MPRTALILIIACFTVLSIGPAFADRDKDESGRGRWNYDAREYCAPQYKGGEYKEEYRDRNCKIERKWTRGGSYKEEWKCEGNVGSRRAERKQEFWHDGCKIERKWDKDGGYKEERKCGPGSGMPTAGPQSTIEIDRLVLRLLMVTHLA